MYSHQYGLVLLWPFSLIFGPLLQMILRVHRASVLYARKALPAGGLNVNSKVPRFASSMFRNKILSISTVVGNKYNRHSLVRRYNVIRRVIRLVRLSHFQTVLKARTRCVLCSFYLRDIPRLSRLDGDLRGSRGFLTLFCPTSSVGFIVAVMRGLRTQRGLVIRKRTMILAFQGRPLSLPMVGRKANDNTRGGTNPH